jgi:hypothetical protein
VAVSSGICDFLAKYSATGKHRDPFELSGIVLYEKTPIIQIA